MAYQGCFGCWILRDPTSAYTRYYLPQVELTAHTTIQSTASRTKLQQTFFNNTSSTTSEVQYTFPLYDGVSVVSFRCTIGDKIIYGVVKEKNEARIDYNDAVARGQAAGLLEQTYEASDVFSTKIGNIPHNGKAIVEIEYVGELKHDAQLDGNRFTIPSSIAPRYGTFAADPQAWRGKLEVVVDVEIDEGAQIEGVSSPSHPIAMSLGRTSQQEDEFKSNRASATLSLGTTELGKDFVIVIKAQDQGVPKALLEEHPDIPNHRALMATLVPRFNLPNIHPEIVFVVDRSGSMNGKMAVVVEALKVFLKSMPLSAKFNICSFGTGYTFLFSQSMPYDERSLTYALNQVDTFQADYGGTELLVPIKDTVKRRLGAIPLEIMVLTDGDIWNQQETFDFVNESAKQNMRLFSLGIGDAASTSLVEGLARAGHGFAQFVRDNEKMDKRVVRMLKAALSPHINDYYLQVNYGEEEPLIDDDFEMVESNDIESSNVVVPMPEHKQPQPVSLFDTNFKETSPNPPVGRYDHLPSISSPNELQAPHIITGLFPFNRVSAYLLLPDGRRNIKSVLLKGTYNGGPIELEIPVQKLGQGKTIHQLAAKKAMLETEEGRGWLSVAKAADGTSLKTKHDVDWERIVEREAVRLGVQHQVAGKFCSFVAVEKDSKTSQVINVSEPRENPPQYTEHRGNPFGGPAVQTASYSMSPGAATSSFSVNKKKSGGFFANMTGSSFGFGSNNGSTGLFGNPQSAAKPQMFRAPSASTSFGRGGLSQPMRAMPFGKAASSPSSGGGLFGAAPPPPPPPPPGATSTQGLFGAAAPTSFVATSAQGMSSVPASGPPNQANTLFNLDFSTMESNPVLDNFDFDTFLKDSEEGQSASVGTYGLVQSTAHAAPNSLARGRKEKPSTVEGKVHEIIALQRFDGSWNAVDELFELIEVWKGDFVDSSMKYVDETVNATILVIAWLEKGAWKEKEIWEMVVDKAKQWLAATHDIADADDAIHQAIKIFFP